MCVCVWVGGWVGAWVRGWVRGWVRACVRACVCVGGGDSAALRFWACCRYQTSTVFGAEGLYACGNRGIVTELHFLLNTIVITCLFCVQLITYLRSPLMLQLYPVDSKKNKQNQTKSCQALQDPGHFLRLGFRLRRTSPSLSRPLRVDPRGRPELCSSQEFRGLICKG